MISKFLRDLWEKRESASSHFAWGLALELAFVMKGAHPETAFVAVILAAAAWEVGGEIVTRRLGTYDDVKPWASRALDVPPWILGAGLGWFFISL